MSAIPPTANIEWAEPPARRNGKGNSKWLPVIAELKKRPGQWAKITTLGSSTTAHNLAREIQRGAGHWGNEGTFEAAGRGCDVYARYIGGGPS